MKTGLWIVSSLMSVAALNSTARAADEVLQEVVVVAVKQPYRGDVPLENLPQSIQVIAADTLSTAGVTKLEGALDFASGVVRQNSFGNLWDSFAIRGFAGDENLPSIYLVNGFSAGRGFSGRRDAVNLDSVEVFKGPGSALVGRADPGGTVNIVTKKPQFAQSGSVELSAASFSTYRVAADYTGPLSDALAVRINGAYENAKSFRDTVQSKRYLLAPSLLANLGDSTTLSYELELLKQETPFDRGVVAINEQLGLVPHSRFYGEPNDGPITIKATGHQLTLQHEFNSNWSLLAGAGYRDSSFEGFSSDAELAANRQSLYFSATNLLARQRRYRDYYASDLSGRLELTGKLATGAIRHHVLVGVDAYDYELGQIQNRFRAGANQANPAYGINVFNPVYGQALPVPAAFTNTLEKQSAQGLYVMDQMDLTVALKLQIGVRLDRFQQRIINRIANTVTEQDDAAFSPRIGLSYDFNDSMVLYSNFAKGFRPNSGLDAANRSFEPERSRSYEVGTKLQITAALSATVAGFVTYKNNFLTADPANAGFSLAVGEAKSHGMELDAQVLLRQGMNLLLSYAYVDAQTTRDTLELNFARAVPAGSPLINVPRNSANAWLSQDIKLGQSVFKLGAGLTYVDERLGETGVPSFVLPDYTLVNALIECAPLSNLKFSVNVGNVFDKVYYPSSYARVWVAAGAPRTFTFRARYGF